MSNIIIFDMKTVTGVQLLTEDFININLEPKDIQYLEIHDPVSFSELEIYDPVSEAKNELNKNDFEVAYAKIVIINANKVLKNPVSWEEKYSSSEAAKIAYERLLSRNIYGISVVQNDECKSYYFTPEDWLDKDNVFETLPIEEMIKISNDHVNKRILIEKYGNLTTIIARYNKDVNYNLGSTGSLSSASIPKTHS